MLLNHISTEIKKENRLKKSPAFFFTDLHSTKNNHTRCYPQIMTYP